jgi:hypothetical protein
VGAACRGDLAAAFLSSPASVDSAFLLPFCFLAWVTGVFDFAAGDGFCLPSTAISPLADCALPLPFCFLASIAEVFDLSAGPDLCRLAAIALELAATVSNWSKRFCFLPSVAEPRFQHRQHDGRARACGEALQRGQERGGRDRSETVEKILDAKWAASDDARLPSPRWSTTPSSGRDGGCRSPVAARAGATLSGRGCETVRAPRKSFRGGGAAMLP